MDPALFMSFLLTLFRVSLIVFLLPFYGGEYIPVQVKMSVCLVLTLALWPHLSFPGSYFPAHPFGIALLMLSELLVGLMMGLTVHFVFAGIQTGGQMLGFQMGFTMVQIADPAGGGQISITSHLLYMVTLVIFLTLDGHLVLLRALTATFRLIPPGEFFFRPPVFMDVIRLSGGMFTLAVKIAAPVLCALFLIELALALMARAAPQMNLLMVGMPLKIGVGFFFMGLIFTLLGKHIESFIIDMGPMFTNLLRLGSPGLQ